MKVDNVKRIFAIAPSSTQMDRRNSKQAVHALKERMRIDGIKPDIFLATYDFHEFNGSNRTRKLRAMIDAELIILMRGNFNCRECSIDRPIMEALDKKMVFENDLQFSTSPEEIEGIWDRLKQIVSSVDNSLERVMTNPQKRERIQP